MTTLELEARLDNLLSTAREETKDIDIFAPIPEKEECPICMIPLPLNENQIIFKVCCGKSICIGCSYKHMLTDINEKGASWRDDYKCPFCQQRASLSLITNKNNVKATKRLMKKNNSEAFMQMATRYKNGEGVFQSHTKALEMYIRAAELGEADDAFDHIGYSYDAGIVVEQNMSKALEFYEVAAKKGSMHAHRHLASFHMDGNVQESIKHLKVIASAGNPESMDALMLLYKDELYYQKRICQQ